MVIKNAIELAPVDIKIDSQGSRIACTSMDNSLKIYDLDEGMESLQETLVFDSNLIDSNN